MNWQDDSWKDGYDEWKLRSPYDDEPEEECWHEEREIDWQGLATCNRCGKCWEASATEMEIERAMSERCDRYYRRIERRERIERLIDRVAFWRRWRKPRSAEIDDGIPF